MVEIFSDDFSWWCGRDVLVVVGEICVCVIVCFFEWVGIVGDFGVEDGKVGLKIGDLFVYGIVMGSE